MKTNRTTEPILWRGAVTWEGRFPDSEIPLPDGTSYKAYLIQRGEKMTGSDQHEENAGDQRSRALAELLQRLSELERSEARHKRIAEELRQANQQLEEAVARKDRFLSIIAHDLRNPFHGLLGITELLMEHIENVSKDEIKTLIREWRKTGEAVQTMLENLLVWSRLQEGQIEYAPERLALATLVDRNLELFAPVARQKQITAQSTVQAAIIVRADYHMLDTVIRNLLSNALKFTQKGGTIAISARQSEHSVEVAFSDTGTGIRAQDLPKLFRIDQKCTRKGTCGEKGTGLGLILCKEFIEKNGGQLGLTSVLGQGSTFRFTLPRYRHPAPGSPELVATTGGVKGQDAAAACSTAVITALLKQ